MQEYKQMYSPALIVLKTNLGECKQMSRLIDSAAGYGTFWIDMAEAFSRGQLEEFVVECPTMKDATQLRFEFYSFRQDAKETYPELIVLKASLHRTEEGVNLLFTSRDKSIASQLLKTALLKHGVIVSEGDSGDIEGEDDAD